MKKKLFTFLALMIPVISVSLLIGIGYYGYYMWWGQRHSVLYDVEHIKVEESTTDEDVYYITFSVSVKNWPHDLKEHIYKLEEDITGEYGTADFEANCRYFSSEPFKKNSFKFYAVYDEKSGNGTLVEEMIYYSRFIAVDADGNEVESATLYMADFENVPIERVP